MSEQKPDASISKKAAADLDLFQLRREQAAKYEAQKATSMQEKPKEPVRRATDVEVSTDHWDEAVVAMEDS